MTGEAIPYPGLVLFPRQGRRVFMQNSGRWRHYFLASWAAPEVLSEPSVAPCSEENSSDH